MVFNATFNNISFILNFKLILDRCDVDNHRIESKTTIESAVNNPLVLLGDGTDLLILLLFHFDLDSNDIIFQINENQLNYIVSVTVKFRVTSYQFNKSFGCRG
jgi:hypothetical protein